MRDMRAILAVSSIGALIAAAPASAQYATDNTPGGGGGSPRVDEYLVDDGTGETNLAWSSSAGGDLVSINQFNVLAGFESLTDISVAWGTGTGGGTASVMIYDDPNNDGDPSDITSANVLANMAIVTGAGGDTFTVYGVGSVNVGSVGDSFFIGIYTSTDPGEFPARIDLTAPQARSWVAGGDAGTIDPADPSTFALPFSNLTGFSFNGNFMVRANAIPAPGALALLGLGGLAATRRRR